MSIYFVLLSYPYLYNLETVFIFITIVSYTTIKSNVYYINVNNFSPQGILEDFGYVVQWKICLLMIPNSAFFKIFL